MHHLQNGKANVSLASSAPNLNCNYGLYSRLATFVTQLIKPQETSRNNVLGVDIQRESPHLDICGKMKELHQKRATYMNFNNSSLHSTILLEQHLLKESRIQGLVAVA